MCSTASRAECTCNLWLTDINECTENTDGCKEGSFPAQYCTDLTPEAEGERLFNCSCPAGFEVFTAAGQNGFGTVVQYGEDVEENPGDVRVIDKSCIRTYTSCLTTRCSHSLEESVQYRKCNPQASIFAVAGSACPNPRNPPIANGELLAPSTQQYFLTGDTVTVLCDLGYYIGTADSYVLEQTLTCNNGPLGEPGVWDMAVPSCVRECSLLLTCVASNVEQVCNYMYVHSSYFNPIVLVCIV